MKELISRYPSLSTCREDIENAVDHLEACFRRQGKVYLCGNGGSAADAEHIVGELMKGFLLKRSLSPQEVGLFDVYGEAGAHVAARLQGALPAISLAGSLSLSTAIINDTDGDMTFAQAAWGFVREQDALVGISTSGNAANVQYAALVARARSACVIGLTGKHGGKLRALCDVCICVPETETYKVQELHLPVYHFLCAEMEKRFFAS